MPAKERPRIYSPALFIPEEEKNELSICPDDVGTNDQFIEHISSTVESHYTLDSDEGTDNDRDQFVGGMGENDGGVWFVVDEIDEFDTLDYWEQIRGKPSLNGGAYCFHF